jgi:hypothetical protein
MREKMLGRWAIRLSVAGSLCIAAVVLGTPPVMAGPDVGSDLTTVPGVVSVDSVYTTTEGGPLIALMDVQWT